MTSAIYSETAPLVPEILHPNEKRRKLMCHSSSSTHVDKRRRRPRTTSTVKISKEKSLLSRSFTWHKKIDPEYQLQIRTTMNRDE